METDLINHPKSLRLAVLLKEPRAWTRVVQLWMWAIQFAPTGDLSDFSEHELAVAMGYNNVGAGGIIRDTSVITSLKKSGFIDEDGKIHGWWRIAQYLRKSRLDRLRKRRKRHADVRRTSRGRPRDFAPDLDLDLDLTGQRQDKTVPPLPPTDAVPFQATAADPPKPTGPIDCPACQRILAHLNERTARTYNAPGAVGESIHLRHSEFGEATCIRVIDVKVDECGRNPKSWKFVSPNVLFKAANFDMYRNQEPAREEKPPASSNTVACRRCRKPMEWSPGSQPPDYCRACEVAREAERA